MSAEPTACVLIIGNEILSGKTQDTNLQFLGFELAKLGIRLAEGRVVRDEPAAIIRHVNETRREFTYVFTTGGIGPTHDDITAECVAQAFGVPLELNDDAVARLQRGGRPLNEARLKMARIPRGAELVDNPVSNAPGFRIENVFVFAGIPSIARAMFANAVPLLVHGAPILSASVDAFLREGDFAAALTSIQQRYPTVEIGSYPFNRDGKLGATLVARGTDRALLAKAVDGDRRGDRRARRGNAHPLSRAALAPRPELIRIGRRPARIRRRPGRNSALNDSQTSCQGVVDAQAQGPVAERALAAPVRGARNLDRRAARARRGTAALRNAEGPGRSARQSFRASSARQPCCFNLPTAATRPRRRSRPTCASRWPASSHACASPSVFGTPARASPRRSTRCRSPTMRPSIDC